MRAEDFLAKAWSLLDRRLGAGERAWLRSLESLSGAGLSREFAAIGRRMGRAPLVLTASERAWLEARGFARPFRERHLDDLARAAVLLSACRRLAGFEQEALVIELYRAGGSRERRSILRCLALLPEAPLFLPLALQASRDPDPGVFEAVACSNPFPAATFPEHAFNELVLRALSVGIRLDRIVGLESRRTPALARLALGVARKKRAAGRGLPADFRLLEVTVR